mgnify:CR=1 FL=1
MCAPKIQYDYMISLVLYCHIYKTLFFFLFFFFVFSRAASAAYGGSQAGGLIGATAASLYHSHSNVGSEPHFQPNHSSQQCQILN